MIKKSKETPQETDAELIEAIKSGSEQAFERFVSRYEDRIFGFGMKVCGDPEDARDIMQETFLKAFKSLRDLKSADALRTWLYRIAANACLLKRRKGKFEPERVLSLQALQPSSEEPARKTITEIGLRPDEAYLQKERLEAIKESILAIPHKYKLVLVLRDMEGLSAEETGRILDLTVPTVKIRLHRARLFFEKLLEKRFEARKGKGHEKVQRRKKM